jgi:hypothetical protein
MASSNIEKGKEAQNLGKLCKWSLKKDKEEY